MSKKDDQCTVREAFQLNMRGLKLWWSESPRFLIATAAKAIVTALTPYGGIYLSARIINEIAGARDPQALTWLVLTALISAALLALLNAIVKRLYTREDKGIWYQKMQIYNRKLLSMDFHSVDDPHARDLLSQVKQNANWGGWGLWRMTRNLNDIVESIMKIFGAVALTITLFTLTVPESGGSLTALNNPLFSLLIIAVMLAVTFISPALSVKAGSYWVKYADEAKMGNRYFSFFGFMGYERPRAPDIRIYRQDILCTEVIKGDFAFSPKSSMAKQARGPIGGLEALSAAVSHVFTGAVYIFVCLKALGGAFGVGSVTQYVGSITALADGMSKLLSTLGICVITLPFFARCLNFWIFPMRCIRGA